MRQEVAAAIMQPQAAAPINLAVNQAVTLAATVGAATPTRNATTSGPTDRRPV